MADSSDDSEKDEKNVITSSDFTKIKIKQEPPDSPRKEILSNISDLFKDFNKKCDPDEEVKESVEPVKSSNEILAELFKVFNAAPPKSLLGDEYTNTCKVKKSKHKKKSKKRDLSSNDETNDLPQNRRYKHKKKKRKSSKDSKNNRLTDSVKTHKSKNIATRSDVSDFVISDEDDTPSICKNTTATTTTTSKTTKVSSTKNKSSTEDITAPTTNSCTAESKNIKKSSGKRSRDEAKSKDYYSSELSLSDEESYLTEKEKYDKRAARKSRHGTTTSRFDKDRQISKDVSSKKSNSWKHDVRSRSRHRHRSRSRTRSPSRELAIDKRHLLEIARKNVILMVKNGSLPGNQKMSQEVKDKVLTKMRYGGQTVEDLTQFCKKLAKGDSLNDFSSLSSDENSDHDKNGGQKAFHHPFVLKDRGPIIMNIKNATPIPPKSAEQVKNILMQYPVSSGQHHRLNENEWVPVPPKKPNQDLPLVALQTNKQSNTQNKTTPTTPANSDLGTKSSQLQESTCALPPKTDVDVLINSVNTIPTPELRTEALPTVTVPAEKPHSIFPEPNLNLDVSSIITKRLNAMRKLQENPTDTEALKMMYNSQKDMSAWATSKFTPGQFMGCTGAQILTDKELSSGYQAWARKDQLIATAPVSGGMGMHLLQKMGWRPGEGLGKEKNGSLQPLLLEVKLDKKGLVAGEEGPSNKVGRRRARPSVPVPNSTPVIPQQQAQLESKHPVSLLGELSAKRKWGAPYYELVDENGPAHQKNFIFKVIVDGMMYQPSITCNTKKEAKALAAKYCLQQLGILPA